jgi:hypothetical protein
MQDRLMMERDGEVSQVLYGSDINKLELTYSQEDETNRISSGIDICQSV